MILKLEHYAEELGEINRNGLPQGMFCGWQSLSQFYRPNVGYMTVVTGIPGHGKSEMVDAIMVNLAHLHGWKFAIYSPENYPIALHAIKLVEKYIGLSHGEMSTNIRQDAHEWIDEHFSFIYPNDDQSTLPRILEFIEEVRTTTGCQGFVIDPWNEIDHRRPDALSETEYISQSLTKVRRFAREKEVHAWLVAHPTKLKKNEKESYDPPTPYDISGSSHWRNKADFCLTVHRDDFAKTKARLLIQKVKQKNFGRVGETSFDYDYKSGRYSEDMEQYGNQPEVHY